MAFRDRWRKLFNFLLNMFLSLKKPLILILWLRRDFIECPGQKRRNSWHTLFLCIGKTIDNNKPTKIKFSRTKKYFILKVCYWAYMLWFNFFFGLNCIFLCFKLIIIHYHTTKQRKIKIWTLDKIEPQNIHACLFRSQIKSPRSSLNAYDSKDYKGPRKTEV